MFLKKKFFGKTLTSNNIICKTVKYIDQSDNRFCHLFSVLIPKDLVAALLIGLLKVWTVMWPHTYHQR